MGYAVVESGHLAKSRWSASDERETFGELTCNGCSLLVGGMRVVWGRGRKTRRREQWEKSSLFEL